MEKTYNKVVAKDGTPLYYKVVSRDGAGLYSAWIKDQGLQRCVKEYKVGKTTKGKGTKLFIFGSFSEASSWAIGNLRGMTEIYECKATGVEDTPRNIPIINDLMEIENPRIFWKSVYLWWRERTKKCLKGKLQRNEFQVAPDGTLVANSVTLLRKVL